MSIYTDVEEIGEWVPTSFPVFIDGVPEVVASCYAEWRTPSGELQLGVVTVAHAFQGPGQQVAVAGADGKIPGRVYARSDLLTDGLDVGLVALDDTDTDLLLPSLPGELNPGAASTSSVINLLGISDTDAQFARIESFCSAVPAEGRALAYYVTRTINALEASYQLRCVVLSDGPSGTFAAGRSGSSWIAFPTDWNPSGIALQSHGHIGSGFRLGLGTHLSAALQWLSRLPNVRNFAWRWQP